MAPQNKVFAQGQNANRWEDWTNLILGGWLFFAPWVLTFTAGAAPAGATAAPETAVLNAAAWNAWIFGVIIALIAAAALFQVQKWEEWTNLAIGAWVAISPWALGFSNLATAAWNAVIIGILVFCVAAWDLYTIPGTPTMSGKGA